MIAPKYGKSSYLEQVADMFGITWNTNIAATSQVEYETTASKMKLKNF